MCRSHLGCIGLTVGLFEGEGSVDGGEGVIIRHSTQEARALNQRGAAAATGSLATHMFGSEDGARKKAEIYIWTKQLGKLLNVLWCACLSKILWLVGSDLRLGGAGFPVWPLSDSSMHKGG